MNAALEAVRDACAAIAREQLAEGLADRDRDGRFPREAFRRLGREGWLAASLPKASGGRGLGLRGVAATIEGLLDGADDHGFAVSMIAHQIAMGLIARFGDPSQRERWLPRLGSGDCLAAIANSEPKAGTDILGLRARAEARDDAFLLSGRKASITNVGEAELVIVSARIAGPRDRGVNAFVVELPAAGAHTRPVDDLIGLRTSPTGHLFLRHVEIPRGARLGEEGIPIFRETFSAERLLCGYVFRALIRRSLASALEHAAHREQFGRSIGENQHVQERIVRMHTADQLLDAHLDRLLENAARGRDFFGALSIVKLHGLEAALDATEGLLRILGGRGLRRNVSAERWVRDALTLTAFGGTVELHKNIAFGELARRPADPRTPQVSAVSVEALSEDEQAALVAITSAALPNANELAGRYYYDVEPSEVILAREGTRIVGFRAITYRELAIGGAKVLAAGVGVAVSPEHQRRGVGTALTDALLRRLRQRGTQLALAFVFPDATTPLLARAGFRRLHARVSYECRETSTRVQEAMACYALALDGADWLAEIEGEGHLDLGRGTF